jgi:zinc transport system ATP-binding protein
MSEITLNTQKPIIEAKNLSVSFGKQVVLQNINFKIYPGDYIGLIGRNGSGKSTLMKTILGLIPPIQGQIEIYGENLNTAAFEKIGYVPQMHQIAHEFPATVKDIVAIGLYRRKTMQPLASNEIHERIALALHKVKMENFMSRPIGHLSGGEQQKVLVAQALVKNPQVLLMDEPTSNLDFVMIRDFLHLLTELNHKYHITILAIQHNLEMLRPFCTRLFMLRRQMLYDGDPHSEAVNQMIDKVFFN